MKHNDGQTAGAQPGELQPKPRRWRKRRIVALAILVPLLILAVAVYIVTRPVFLASQIGPVLSRELGGEVSIGGIELLGTRSVLMRDVSVRSHEHPGVPGEVIFIRKVRVDADLIGLARGRKVDIAVTLSDALFRLAEDESHPNRFTFLTLGGADDDDDGTSPGKLTIALERGLLVVGTFNGAQFTPRGALHLAGSIHNRADDTDTFNFDVRQTDERGYPRSGDTGIALKGAIDTRTFAVNGRVDSVELDQQLQGLCPMELRAWWERLDLTGRINSIEIRLADDGGLQSEMSVRDVGLTIPIDDDRIWARYQHGEVVPAAGQPRMRVEAGLLRYREGSIEFENMSGSLISSRAAGTFQGLPYRVSGTIGPVAATTPAELAAIDVTDVDQIPMNLQFALESFEFDAQRQGQPGGNGIELPAAIAHIFARFAVASCTLDTQLIIQREAQPSGRGEITPPAQPLMASGTATLRNGRGAYEKFPYPLEDIAAQLRFTQDQLEVVTLHGNGPNGGDISITGTIAPIGKWPDVALSLTAHSLPLDANLRTALPVTPTAVFDSILHQPSLDRLRGRNMLPDGDDIARAKAQLAAVDESLQKATDDANNEQLRERLKLQRDALLGMVNAADFAMGGNVDIAFKVRREVGRGQPTHVTGTITASAVGLVLDVYPYPIRVHEGVIEIEVDRARLRSIRGTAIGGGSVLVDGEIRFIKVKGARDLIHPELTISLTNDIINDASIAVLPMIGFAGSTARIEQMEGGLADTADMLRALNLAGRMSFHGRVFTDESDEIDWDIAVALSDASATPSADIASVVARSGLFWPPGFAVEDVNGSVQITRDRFNIGSLTGHRNEGVVHVTDGFIDLQRSDRESALELAFENLDIGEYLLNVLPDRDAARVREVWERYQPRGRFDATLSYRRTKEGAQPLQLSITPRSLTLRLDNEEIPIEGDGSAAQLILGNGAAEFRNLGLRLPDVVQGNEDATSSSPGLVTLSGRVGLGAAEPLHVQGQVTGGRLESAWVREAITLFGDESWAERIFAFNPLGAFDAVFDWQAAGADGAGSFDATLSPHSLSVTVRDTQIDALFGPGGVVTISDGHIVLSNLAGTLASQAKFAVDGEIDATSPPSAKLNLAYTGGVDDELRALLPRALIASLSSIEFATDGPVVVGNAVLDVRSDKEDAAGMVQTAFQGQVELSRASFLAGLAFTEVALTAD
ncbi:MAG: hypothetical protein ACR2GY_07570, partial [Phycisphaerales bacterium]